MRLSSTVAVLAVVLVVCATVASAADWKTAGAAIATMASGGILEYLTETKGKIALYKTLSAETLSKNPPVPRQSFTMSGGWPKDQFSLAVNGYFLNVVNGKPTLQFKNASTGAMWTLTNFAQLKAADSGLCLTIATPVNNQAPTLAACSDKPFTQKWVVSTTGSPSSTFRGLLVSLNPANNQLMCLDITGVTRAGLDLNAQLVKTLPSLQPCDPTSANQMFQARDVIHPKDDYLGVTKVFMSRFPNLAFDIYFPSVQMCLVVTDPQFGTKSGRSPVGLGLADCNYGSKLDTYSLSYWSFWLINSRGQLQNDLQVFAASSDASLPICLSDRSGTPTTTDCSMKAMDNRWQFVYPWVTA